MGLSPMHTTAGRVPRQRPSLSPLIRGFERVLLRCYPKVLGLALALSLAGLVSARDRWVELNIGPYRVDTDGDVGAARETLATLEQLRWVLGGMLENNNLEAVWPFRVLITAAAPPDSRTITLVHGQYLLGIRPGNNLPYHKIASLLLEANTPRLPREIDTAIPLLFDGMEAHGSRVTWAKKPPDATLDWARVQLFATKPEYSGRFRIFVNNLRAGSLVTVAEANAFGKDSKTLESEVAAYLPSAPTQGITISGRPLDPKRDVGEHDFDADVADLYLGDIWLETDRSRAEQNYKAAGNAGFQALAQEGLARLILQEKGDPREYLDRAIAAGSKDAWIYAKAAEGRPPPEAAGLLQTARELNPRWWLPAAKLADLAQKPAEKEALLLEACRKDPRSAALWQSLAELQSRQGKGSAAQNSWIRAEDAAATPAERARIHQRRESLENERLDAEAAARRKQAEAAQAEDNRLRNEQLARIHSAEQRANTANGGDGQASTETGVAHWWNSGERPVDAELIRVDCLGQQARLRLKTGAGKVLSVLVVDPSKVEMYGANATLACGAQQPARKVSLNYKPRIDKAMGTSGDVVTIHFE